MLPFEVYALPAVFIFLAAIITIWQKFLPEKESPSVARPNPVVYRSGAAAGVTQGIVLFAGMFFDNLGYLALLFVAAFIGLGVSLYLTSLKSVKWGPEGVQGPAKAGLSLQRLEDRMRWEEISSVKSTLSSHYLEAADGRKIFWSNYFRGSEDFVHALRLHRPTLPLPTTLPT